MGMEQGGVGGVRKRGQGGTRRRFTQGSGSHAEPAQDEQDPAGDENAGPLALK